MRTVLSGIGVLALALGLAAPGWAQTSVLGGTEGLNGGGGDAPSPRATVTTKLAPPFALPRMAPELALETCERRADRQVAELGASTETMVVRAELPNTRQQGEFELKRYYRAPKGIAFAAVKFVGDTFIKTNVIARLLQSEVDHVQKGDGGDMSLSSRNYKFNFKNTEIRDGRTVHVYHVKPRKKRVGLFKGRIYIDAYTGSLVRVEGTLVKSPSFFIKKVEFVQEYQDVGEYTFPSHIHSSAKTRLVGQAVIDIVRRDFETQSVSEVHQQPAPAQPSQQNQ